MGEGQSTRMSTLSFVLVQGIKNRLCLHSPTWSILLKLFLDKNKSIHLSGRFFSWFVCSVVLFCFVFLNLLFASQDGVEAGTGINTGQSPAPHPGPNKGRCLLAFRDLWHPRMYRFYSEGKTNTL